MEERDFKQLLTFDASFLLAAHEMKTPLSIIRQLSLTLNDPQIDLTKTETERILRQIDLTSERALRLVNDLTKVARLEDAMFELEPVNTRKICFDIVEEMKNLYGVHGREIIFKNRKKASLVVANYDLLRSILLNLSDNALAASDKNSKVELDFSEKADKVRIMVRNYGDELPLKIWRNIKKAHAKNSLKPVSAASRPQSSGLGIYIAQNFALEMNGKIGVIKHRDGNTFYVELNRSEQLSLL